MCGSYPNTHFSWESKTLILQSLDVTSAPPKPVRTRRANSLQGRVCMWPLLAWGCCKSKSIVKYLAGMVLSRSNLRSCRENISDIHMFVTVFTGWWKYICRTLQCAAEENSFLPTSHVSRHSCWLLGIAWSCAWPWLGGHRPRTRRNSCCTDKQTKSLFLNLKS